MRISELSQRSGFSIPTIKLYLRRGILHRGELSSRTQAQYGPSHLRRLKLIRTLTQLAGLDMNTVELVLECLREFRTADEPVVGDVLNVADKNQRRYDREPDPATLAMITRFVRGYGWADTHNRARIIACLYDDLRDHGCSDPVLSLAIYGRLAEDMADLEMRWSVEGQDGRAAALGLLLGSALFRQLHSLALHTRVGQTVEQAAT